MVNLRECPLCGSSEIIKSSECYGMGDYRLKIECRCGISFSVYDEEETINKWNTRQDD